MHTRAGFGSTRRGRELATVLAASAGLWCPGALAQPGVVERFEPPPAGDASPAGVPARPGLDAPDPAETLRCLALVRAWLDAWEVGGVAPPLAAACVTLRLGDEIVGRAEAFALPDADGRGVLEGAAAEAITQARARLPMQRDVLESERARAWARTLTVSIELGGLPAPVEVESFEQVALEFSPGVMGVGARIGTGAGARVALVFPSAMLSSGMDAGAALGSAAAEALEQADAALLNAPALSERGVRFLAFDCSWAAEVGIDRAGLILQRGGRTFETRDVSTPMLQELGQRLAGVIAASDAGRAAGAGQAGYEPALRALALARWAAAPRGASTQEITSLRADARRLLAGAGEGDQSLSAATAAMWVIAESALRESDGSAPPPAPRAESPSEAERAALSIARGRAAEALARALAPGPEPSPALGALLAWAGAIRAGATSDPAMLRQSEAVLRDAYARTAPGEWVTLLPWAGWAEQEIARVRTVLTGEESPMEAAGALREIREVVWKHQVGSVDVSGPDRDLIGGIVFTRGRQPLPTWQSLRPLAFMATMMGDPVLTAENEFPGQVLRMLSSLRFLRQLCADEAVMAWSDGTPWGVRASVWTDDQPAEATPMGLLMIAETLRSLEEVRARRQAATGPSTTGP